MKLVALCLFAVCCSSLVNAMTTASNGGLQKRKLEEVLRELKEVKSSLENTEVMISTPPQDIKDCCYLSALQCFRSNLHVHFNVDKKQRKLHRSLGSHLTERSLNFCNSGNIPQENSTCPACDSHPKVTGREFFNRLKSLIQRALSKLSMK